MNFRELMNVIKHVFINRIITRKSEETKISQKQEQPTTQPTIRGLEHHSLTVWPHSNAIVGLHSGVVGAVEMESVHRTHRLLPDIHLLRAHTDVNPTITDAD